MSEATARARFTQLYTEYMQWVVLRGILQRRLIVSLGLLLLMAVIAVMGGTAAHIAIAAPLMVLIVVGAVALGVEHAFTWWYRTRLERLSDQLDDSPLLAEQLLAAADAGELPDLGRRLRSIAYGSTAASVLLLVAGVALLVSVLVHPILDVLQELAGL